jgi:phytoene synthase
MDELTAAGITDPALRKSYAECKRLNAQHGKTYYLATLLLPPAKRPFVHALYGFARYADEIVDDLNSTLSDEEKAKALKVWGDGVLGDIKIGKSHDHIGAALVDTVKRFDIPLSYFEAFLKSMTMDLTVTEYRTYEDLLEYVYGSAAVIGLQMVPILGALNPDAYAAAEKLGIAFQLANFIRDVGEDLERGRVYLPITELQASGVTREMLEERVLTPEIKAALQFQISRVRELQRQATPGIAMLSPESRACIEAASELYCGIVDEVEKINYEIFDKRAKTSTWRRVKVALPAFIRARKARAKI